MGDAFYTPPEPLPDGEPGTVLYRSERASQAGGRSWKLMYLSTSVTGEPIAVTGVLWVPEGPAPPGGRPVVSYAHGTTGSADACAPSLRDGYAVPYLDEMLSAGYVVVATDYEGLGVPGPHPYLVGVSEGRSVLDAARAARRVAEAGASNHVAVLGHSQGGHAALWAGEIAADHAPELDVVGAVGMAPASRVSLLYAFANTTTFASGFVVAAAAGMQAAHPELALEDLMTPEALGVIGILEVQCIDQVIVEYVRLGEPVIATSGFELPDWEPRIRENDNGEQASDAPVLVTQGQADPLVVPVMTQAYVAEACAAGSIVSARYYDGAAHGSVLDAGRSDVLAWIAARFAGEPPPSDC